MGLLMDGLLMAASLFAGAYCWVLARRVKDLKDLDKGLGGSIVNLTRQIELARATLDEARNAAKDTRHDLSQLSARAEAAAAQLRLLIATVKPPEAAAAPTAPPVAQRITGTDGAKAPAPRPLVLPETVDAREETRPEPKLAAPATARPDPAPRAAVAPDIPKPRALPPLNGLLRRTKPEAPVIRDEDEILDALRAIAGGGR